MAAVLGGFILSTVPGVRPHPGYNLYLDGILNNVAYGISPIVCWMRARRSSSSRWTWRIVAIALALYGAGNVFWTVSIRPLDPQPFPSGADVLWLSFYPLVFAALLLFLRDRLARLSASLWLDGLVGGLAVAAGAAAAFVGPILAVNDGSAAAVVTTMLYPLLDLLVLFVVVAVLALFHWRPPRGLWFLAAGLAAFAVVDAAYLVAAARGTYEPGGPLDACWVLATVLIAFAPGWPDRTSGRQLPGWALLGVPVVSTVGALCLLVYANAHDVHPIAIVLASGTILAALGRLIAAFREATLLAHSHVLAVTDELTGLGNRRAFYDAIRAQVAPEGSHQAALLLLDLDRFKEVNDSLGHHAGDDLLIQVGQRIAAAVHGRDDMIARLGGDEFTVLLNGVDRSEAEHVASRIRDMVAPPYALDGVTVRIGVSIGIALAPDHGTEASSLLRRADIAMYHAKGTRSGQYVFDADEHCIEGEQRLRMLEELRSALIDGDLLLHYQPKVEAMSRAVTGVEALVRWQHPTRGLIHPCDFLPLVEDAGLMRELTIQVLAHALAQVARWQRAGRRLTVAVNLSASSLVDVDLPDRIAAILEAHGLSASALELEITEDSLMVDRERAREILSRLRAVGVRVAVDDFGTGYSSLSYLRELPIDELKLDRSFVCDMAADRRSAAIVRSAIGLAHSLGLSLVAEGVEDEVTADELARAGCDEAQGFYFSRPLPASELEVWLDDHDRRLAEDLGDWNALPRLFTGALE